MRGRLPLVVAVLSIACRRTTSPQGGADLSGPVAEAKVLLEKGDLDAALAKLQELPEDPDSLYYQGRVWAKKAESAPLPTPPPLPQPLPRGADAPKPPEFKREELTALELFQRALAARSDHAPAHLAMGELLAPHALRGQELEKEEAARRRPHRKGAPEPSPTPTPVTTGIDYSVDRVIQAYQLAAQADPVSREPAEALIRFGVRSGRLNAAETGYQELIRRVRENPEPHIRFGDFLLKEKKEPAEAIEQYRQALIWKPEDEATRAKIADIFLSRGIEAFGKQQYGVAEAQFKQADKYITDRSSPVAQRLQNYVARLREIRQPTVR